MKAFLSHSSKDKYLAREIAKELGDLRCEYDEYSFDFILNSHAIRKALDRCDLFVLLLSANSINSKFVDEEIRSALGKRSSGKIKQVLIISIDGTSHETLPGWLREINVAQKLRTVKQIYRRIDAYLTELSLNESEIQDLYFGREDEERDLRRLLAKPKSQTPIAIHVVGHFGVGRKTFLKRTLASIAPRFYSYFLEIPIKEYDSLENFYRRLYEYMEVYNPLVAGEAMSKFRALSLEEKYISVSNYIKEMADSSVFPLFIDEGGVYNDEGDYQTYFSDIMDYVEGIGRPSMSFIQTRMMKFALKNKYDRSYHVRINSLSDETAFELISLKLKDLDLGSGLIDHSQKITVAAMAMAEKKVCAQRS